MAYVSLLPNSTIEAYREGDSGIYVSIFHVNINWPNLAVLFISIAYQHRPHFTVPRLEFESGHVSR
jgi:hypothetical protein